LVPLAAGAGFLLVRVAEATRARGALAAYAVALVPLFAVSIRPHGLDDGRSEERTVMLLWLVDNGQGEEALRRLPAVEAAHPEPARLLLRLGQALDENRAVEAAAQLLERSLALDPSRPETRLALGQALFDAGRPRDAIPYLREALDAGYRPDLAGFSLVQALAAAGDEAEAAARLERLSLPPRTEAMSFLVVGNAALQLRRPDLALRFLDRGIAQDPRVAALREKRGLALVMLERPTEARMELEEARRLDPASASACLNLAVLEAQEGRLDAARVLASEALRLQPDYPQARGLLEALARAR
jgi:tetratricopeptide (TPR) repeat protein